MAEYISREAVVRYLKGYSDKECNSNSPYGMITSSVLNKVERALSEMPAADVQTVRHGRWVECCNELDKKCSCCDKVHGTIYEREPFCPNCGARMEE